jgi:hypothetical protein
LSCDQSSLRPAIGGPRRASTVIRDFLFSSCFDATSMRSQAMLAQGSRKYVPKLEAGGK